MITLRGTGVSPGIAVGPALPISRRSQMGVPVGVRANLALALLATVAWLRPALFLTAIGAGTVLLSIIYLSVK